MECVGLEGAKRKSGAPERFRLPRLVVGWLALGCVGETEVLEQVAFYWGNTVLKVWIDGIVKP